MLLNGLKNFVLIYLLIFFFCGLDAHAQKLSSRSNNPEYKIIVDAGSSGSRFHLFKYYFDKSYNSGQLPIVEDIFFAQVSKSDTPITSNIDHPEQTFSSVLNDLILYLKNENLNLKNISIHVFSTAGMRIVPTDIQNKINRNLETYLKSLSLFKNENVEVRTITGEQEGLFGWLDINYLSDKFNDNQDTSYGSIDVGGASAQLVFSDPTFNFPDNAVQKIKILGKTYRVVTQSFTGMGQDVMRNSVSKQPQFSVCTPHDFPEDSEVTGYSFESCRLNYINSLKNRPSNLNINTYPNNDKLFIAYSSVYYSYKFFGLNFDSNLDDYKNTIIQECSKNWNSYYNDNKEKTPLKYLINQCANGTYIHHLLSNLFNVSKNQINILNSIYNKRVNKNFEIDWTLGALIYYIR